MKPLRPMRDFGEVALPSVREKSAPTAGNASSGPPVPQEGDSRTPDTVPPDTVPPDTVPPVAVTPGGVTPGAVTPGGVTRGGVITWLVLLTAVGGIASALRYEPPRGIRIPGFAKPLPELCNSQRMLGIDCPGCGLTRSFVLSAQQQWGRAFQIHPFGTMAFGFLMLLFPYRVWQASRLVRGRPPQSTTVTELAVLGVFAGGSVLWWIGRLFSGAAIGA